LGCSPDRNGNPFEHKSYFFLVKKQRIPTLREKLVLLPKKKSFYGKRLEWIAGLASEKKYFDTKIC
jgi:hypothetical protein